jgi:predicted thioredoxin/glutaredoxin
MFQNVLLEKISGTEHVKHGEVLQRVRRKGISYMEENEEKLTGLVTSGVGTAF